MIAIGFSRVPVLWCVLVFLQTVLQVVLLRAWHVHVNVINILHMHHNLAAFIFISYIEDIQMILLNMAFISSSEVENIYIS